MVYTGSNEMTVVVTIDENVYDDVYIDRDIGKFTLWYKHNNVKYRGTVDSDTLVNGVGTITFKFPTDSVGVYAYRIELATGLREVSLVKSKRIAVGAVEKVTMESPIKAYSEVGIGSGSLELVIDPDNLYFMLLPCDSAGVVTTTIGTTTITKVGGVNQLDTADWSYLVIKQVDLAYNQPVDTGVVGTFPVALRNGATGNLNKVVNVNEPFTVRDRLSTSSTITSVVASINGAFSNSGLYTSVYASPITITVPITYI